MLATTIGHSMASSALGAPVKLSVGRVRLRRWLPGPRGLAAGRSRDTQRVVAYLHHAVPRGSRRSALALVPVDDTPVAALALASLAMPRTEQGKRVAVADLCPGAPAARLLGAADPGVTTVQAGDLTGRQ
jgi:hypothetical protein